MEGIPSDLVSRSLGFLCRWQGVLIKPVCQQWRQLCRDAEFAPLVMVTASELNAVFVFSSHGCLRQRITVSPWGETDGLDPCGDDTHTATPTELNATHQEWPTCIAAAPRRLFVSQYAAEGIVVFRVDERCVLRYEKIISHMALGFPEGLARVGDHLLVASCLGNVATVNIESGLVTRVARFPAFVFWNVALKGDMLLVAAHQYVQGLDETGTSYDQPSNISQGYILEFKVDMETGYVKPQFSFDRPANVVNPDVVTPGGCLVDGLQKPSGIALVGDDILVTTFVKDGDDSWRREVMRVTPDGSKAVAWPDLAQTSVPWGITGHKDTVWVCGHQQTLGQRDYKTGRLLKDAASHPYMTSANYRTKADPGYVLHYPDRSHTNAVFLV